MRRSATYRANHPERRREYGRTHKRHPSKRRVATLRTYGLTPEAYDAAVAEQGGLCALCGLPPEGRGRGDRLHVDHSHTSGQVRSLLCGKCNTLLGLADEDPAVLQAAIDYLNRWGS